MAYINGRYAEVNEVRAWITFKRGGKVWQVKGVNEFRQAAGL